MVISFDQHDKLGEELQIYYNQVHSVDTYTIGRSIPKKYRLRRLFSRFSITKTSPVFLLRTLLDREVCRQFRSKDGVLNLYFKGGPLDFKVPEFLLGIPTELAEEFHAIQTNKIRALPARKKPRLNEIEMQAITVFLSHFANRMNTVTIDLCKNYHSDHKTVIVCSKILHSIREILEEFQQSSEEVRA